MPTPGLVYRPRAISADEFSSLYLRAVYSRRLKSFIGYEATAKMIERMTGVAPRICREAITHLRAGDELLVAKLRYRLPDPAAKRDPRAQSELSEKDYDFWHVEVLE